MAKSFRGNYSNQMLDQEVVDMSVDIVMIVVVVVAAVAAEWERRIALRHRTRMLLDRTGFSRDLDLCMDSEVDPLRSVARRLRLRGEYSMGRVSR
jgi:peroxiredoxin